MAGLARRYQVSEATAGRLPCRGKAAVAKPDGAEPVAARRIEQLERELAQRTQIIGELSIANDISRNCNPARIERGAEGRDCEAADDIERWLGSSSLVEPNLHDVGRRRGRRAPAV